MLLDIVDNPMKLIQRLGGLREEIHITCEIQTFHILETFNHNSPSIGLSHQSQHFCMSRFAKDDKLGMRVLVALGLDAALQLQHHGTGGINDFDMVLTGQLIGLRRLTVCAEQHLHIMQMAQLLMVDGNESHPFQPLTLHAVVHDVTQTVERGALGQFLLGLADGSGHSEAETTAIVYFYLQHSLSCIII